MRLWFLDNERTDYVIMAEDRDAAWRLMRERHGILPPDAGESDDSGWPAYNEMYEVPKGHRVVSPNDVVFVF